MSLTQKAAQVLLWLSLAALLLYSFRGAAIAPGSELTLLMEPDGTGVWRDLVAQFNREQPGTAVRLIEGPPATNAREDLYSTAFLSGGSGYDIVYADGIWIAKFAAAGWLLDLTDLPSPADRIDFLAVEFDAGTYNGRLYRMPALTDAGVLFYRKDLVPVPPETFGELRTLAASEQTPDRWGYLWQGKQYEGLVTVFLEVLWGYGGDWIDATTRQVRIDSPEALQAVEFLRGTIGTISPEAVTSYSEEETRSIFQNGRAVFLRNWPYVWSLARSSAIGDRIAMAPMPGTENHPGASTLGGWGFAISRRSPNPQRAWQFIEFITRPEQLAQVRQRQGRIPARLSMIQPEFLPILERARPRPSIPEYAQASDILQRWLSAALTGRATPENAIKQVTRETELLLEGAAR